MSVRWHTSRQRAAPSQVGDAVRSGDLIAYIARQRLHVFHHSESRVALKLGTAFATHSPQGTNDDFVVIERVIEVGGHLSEVDATDAWNR